MIGHNWEFYVTQVWFWGKILLVVGLSGFHGYLIGLGTQGRGWASARSSPASCG